MKVLQATYPNPNIAPVRQEPEEQWIDLGICKYDPPTARQRLANVPVDNIRRMTPAADKKRIAHYSRLMARGLWQINPNSRILLGKDDLLLDGYGRMMSVVASGVPIWSHTSKSPLRTSTRGLVVDQAVPRHVSYVLQRPAKLVRAGELGFFMLANRKPDSSELEPFCDTFLHTYERLNVDSKRGLGSSAGVLLAALLCAVSGKSSVGYLEQVLGLMTRRDPKELPPLPYAFYRQVSRRRIHPREMLIRAFRALPEGRRDISTLLIKNDDLAVDDICNLLQMAVEDWGVVE